MCLDNTLLPISLLPVFSLAKSYKTSFMLCNFGVILHVLFTHTNPMFFTSHRIFISMNIEFVLVWKPSTTDETLLTIKVDRSCDVLAAPAIYRIRQGCNLMIDS